MHSPRNTRSRQDSRLHPTSHLIRWKLHNTASRTVGSSGRITRPVDSADVTTTAGGRPGAVGDSNVDVRARKTNVEDHGNKRRSRVACAATDEENPEERVYRASSRDAFHGFCAVRYCHVVVDHGREPVRVDAQYHDRADELDPAEEPLDALKARNAR